MWKWWLIGGFAIVLVIGAGIFVGRWKQQPNLQDSDQRDNQSADAGSSAIQAGRQLAGEKCSGTGSGQLTHSAMDSTDFSFVVPYGLMVGGHVTPIDHQYYSPASYNSARDAYPVYAMGDARLVNIQHRTEQPQDNQRTRETPTSEYRLVFSQSCTFFYYYDLLTSLTPELTKLVDDEQYVNVDVPVKAGDRIGAIGGQTLDFAVWNTEKPLAGFVVPEHYDGEAWKIYTADPLDYETPELRALMLSRSPRVDEPISGKIDWDEDGKLRGTWFLEGTDGIGGDRSNPKGSWVGHLSFAPNLYDPSRWMVSMGDYPIAQDSRTQVSATQFFAKLGSPTPESIGVSSTPTAIELVHEDYVKPDGTAWDQMSFVKGPKVGSSKQSVLGVALIQLIDPRTLQFEVFPNETANQVSGFTTSAKSYKR